MTKLDFYTIDNQEKAAIFNAIAEEWGMTPFAVEKDWWVSRTLNIIFHSDGDCDAFGIQGGHIFKQSLEVDQPVFRRY
jgi:hypothetical protein